MNIEPTDEELRAFINDMLANLDNRLREPEVIDDAIRDCRDMWVMLYRAGLDSPTRPARPA